MSIIDKSLPYMKPILLGTALGAAGGAITAPKGKSGEWALSGGIIGGIGSGPAQIILKRLLTRRSSLAQLAKKEIGEQTPLQIAKWSAIGAGAGAAVTAATGGYKHPERSSKAAQAADLGVDAGGILLRSLPRMI